MAIEDDFNALQQQGSNIEQDFNALQNPQAVPDNQAVQESQFQTPDQMKALETQQVLGSPKDPNFDTSGLQEWEYKGGLVTGAKREPGFLKTLDMLNTGVHRGVTQFTLGIMSMLPFGQKYQNALKKVDADVEAEQQKNIKTYNSIAPVVGELGGELLATAPAGGLLGGVAKAANAVADIAPTGLKLLGKYGTSGLGGASVLSGTDALQYQGDAFDVGKAAGTFTQDMSSPMSYALPMVGTAIGKYLDKTKALANAPEGALPRDLMTGTPKKLYNMMFDSIGMMSPVGARAAQLENIGKPIEAVIRGIAGIEGKVNAEDMKTLASKYIQNGLKHLDAKETLLWENGGFKSAAVNNLDELLPEIKTAQELIQRIKLPSYSQTNALLDESLKGLKDGKVTFEDIKNMGGILGNAATDAYSQGGGTWTQIGSTLSNIRKTLLDKASGNLSGEQLKAYKTAQAFTKSQYELQDSIPLVKDAITDEFSARKIVENILSDSKLFDKSSAMGIASNKGQAIIKGAKVAQALSNATGDTGVNLTSFLKEVAPQYTTSGTEKLLGDEYKYIAGLAKHLSAVNEAKKIGNSNKFAATAIGAGAITGLGATGNLNWDNAKAIAPYAAMLFAANNPVLKRLLGYTTKNVSDSTYKYMTDKIQNLFTRGGFIYNDDGSISKTGDK